MREYANSHTEDAYNRFLGNLIQRMPPKTEISAEHDLIDLTAKLDQQTYIFRIKLFPESMAHEGIGEAVSELYEFSFLNNHNLSDSILILLIENSLLLHLSWMHGYLEKDRQIKLLWNGENELHASPQTREELAFLWREGRN